MDPAMLICSICPQQPDFSDISHLLTHISSKGHLAHLHKLQVKSHQEIAAGVQLTNYNQWYQQYGLASLLSERMQQKEMKQSAKNGTAAARKRGRSVKNEIPNDNGILPASPIQQVRRARARAQVKTNKRERLDDDGMGSDLDYDPSNRNRQLKNSLYFTPIKNYLALPSSPQAGDYSSEIDPTLASTPTGKSAKLKGKIWPGMALFDAATPDEQRRRNQKKDGSVLRRMERLSRLVDPQETVFSAELTMQKQRHIDDLEDQSSLIEGETPTTKPKPRPRRKALARLPSNVPRLVKRKSKAVRPRTQRRVDIKNGLPNIAHIPSSSAHPPYGLQSGYSPTADENMEFQLAVGNLPVRKRTGNFTIFNDNESPTSNLNRYSAYAPMPSVSQSYAMPTQPRLSYSNAPWLQPQNQNPIYFGNQYQAYRPVYSAYQPLQDVNVSKENVIPVAERVVGSGYQTANPLSWKSPQATQGSQSSETSFGSFSGYFATSSGLADPFGYARNPLLDALAHFNAEGTLDPAKHDPGPAQYAEASAGLSKRETASPDDSNETISEANSQEQRVDVATEA